MCQHLTCHTTHTSSVNILPSQHSVQKIQSRRSHNKWQRRLSATSWQQKILRPKLMWYHPVPRLAVSNSPKSHRSWSQISHRCTQLRIWITKRHYLLLHHTPGSLLVLGKYPGTKVPTCELAIPVTSLELLINRSLTGPNPPPSPLCEVDSISKQARSPQSPGVYKGRVNPRFLRYKVDTRQSPPCWPSSLLRVSIPKETNHLATRTSNPPLSQRKRWSHLLCKSQSPQQIVDFSNRGPLKCPNTSLINKNPITSSQWRQSRTIRSQCVNQPPDCKHNKPTRGWALAWTPKSLEY
jgi:hypothetical protein